jgi:hypothetical protein
MTTSDDDQPDVYTYGDVYDAIDVCDTLDVALAKVHRLGFLSDADEERCKRLVEDVRRRLQTAMRPKPPWWRRVMGS